MHQVFSADSVQYIRKYKSGEKNSGIELQHWTKKIVEAAKKLNTN
jgi:hypothetical protein